jgi:hypothetical protein
MVLRSYYLGMLKDKRPEICPLFFQVDWAPSILNILLITLRAFSNIIQFSCRNLANLILGFVGLNQTTLGSAQSVISEGKYYDCRGTLVKCTNHVAHSVALSSVVLYFAPGPGTISIRAGYQTECPARRSCVV